MASLIEAFTLFTRLGSFQDEELHDGDIAFQPWVPARALLLPQGRFLLMRPSWCPSPVPGNAGWAIWAFYLTSLYPATLQNHIKKKTTQNTHKTTKKNQQNNNKQPNNCLKWGYTAVKFSKSSSYTGYKEEQLHTPHRKLFGDGKQSTCKLTRKPVI